MKKLLSILALTGILTTASNALMVADPTSHGYFIEQISQLDKSLKTAQDTYKTATRTARSLERMNKAINGSYDNVGDAYKTLKSLSRNYDYMYRRLSKTEQKIFGRKMRRQNSAVYKDLDKLLKQAGYDPKSSEIYSASDLQKMRMHDRQRRLKESVMTADMAMLNLNKNVKRLQDLSKKIDKTKNLKDSQDFTNRLMVEQLYYLDNMTRLLATFVSSATALQYSGYDELKHEKFKADFAKAKKKRRGFGSELSEPYAQCSEQVKSLPQNDRLKALDKCQRQKYSEWIQEKGMKCVKGLNC